MSGQCGDGVPGPLRRPIPPLPQRLPLAGGRGRGKQYLGRTAPHWRRARGRRVSRRPVCLPMRRSDLQIVRWRRRAQAPAPARPTAVPYRRISPHRDLRTRTQHQLPPDMLVSSAARWSHAPGSGLPSRSGAGKHTCGLLDHPTPLAQPRSSMVGRPRTGAAARSFL